MKIYKLASCVMMQRKKVEELLSQYYLSRKENGDTPLRCIDATEDALSQALKVESNDEAVKILRSHCQGSFRSIFTSTIPAFPKYPDVPGCLAYLILACHAACTVVKNADGQGGRDFRNRLGELLGVDASGSSLQGLPAMWEELKKWCLQNNREYRDIQLPPIRDSRRYIGPTQDITFPTWRDEGKLKKYLPPGEMDIDIIEGRLPKLFREKKEEFSFAFQELCEKHIGLIRKKDPSRNELLFAVFLRGLQPRKTSKSEVILEQSWEGSWKITIGTHGVQDAGRGLSHFLQSTQRATDKISCFARLGLIFFEEMGYGSYRAITNPEECQRGALIWKGPITQKSTPRHFIELGPEWRLATDLALDDFQGILEELKNNPAFIAVCGLHVFSVNGGFSYGASYLHYASLLPEIHVFHEGQISFLSDNNHILPQTVFCSPGDTVAIPSHFATAHTLTIRFIGSLHDEPLRKQRILTLYSHAKLTSIPELKQEVWHCCEEASETRHAPHTFTVAPPWAKASALTSALEAVEECLYFCGKSGWSTGELLRLLSLTLPQSAPQPWDVIRSFEEGGWLYSAWTIRWGVIKRWLVPPTLVEIPQGVLLWGARPQKILECFHAAVYSLGGSIICHPGFSEFSPCFFVACGVSTQALKDKLEIDSEIKWFNEKSFAKIPYMVLPPHPPSFDSMHWTDKHTKEAWWSWSECRFQGKKVSDNTQNNISMRHCSVEDSSRHRLYQVLEGTEVVFTTPVRNVAILYACNRARFPLFRDQENRLLRNGTEGFLPLPIAQILAQIHLKCSGPILRESGWGYAYAINAAQIASLHSMLGAEIFAETAGHRKKHELLHYVVRHRPEQKALYQR